MWVEQEQVIGIPRQAKIKNSIVLIVGRGRIGTPLALSHVSLGVGRIIQVDPQLAQISNIGDFPEARLSDKGKYKVDLMAGFLEGRPGLVYEPYPIPIESPETEPLFRDADIVLSAANSRDARVHAEARAIHYGKPVIQVASGAGEEAFGGMISLHLPGRRLACFAELATNGHLEKKSGLLNSATWLYAAIALNISFQLLAGIASPVIRENNLFPIDAFSLQVEAIAVGCSKDCEICGGENRVSATEESRAGQGVRE